MSGGTNRQEVRRTARGANKLTARAIEVFVAGFRKGKIKALAKLADGEGLYLTVTPAGTPLWRVKYRHGGKERTYSIGPYGPEAPAITLAAARVELAQVKADLRAGRDPLQARNVRRAENQAASADTFREVALEWLEHQRGDWSGIHYKKSKRALERDVFPKIGTLPVKDITPAMVAGVVEAITARGARDTAGKVLQHIGGVFRWAQVKKGCTDNPAAPVHEVLKKRQHTRRRPALLKWTQLGEVLRGAERARLSPAVRMAHKLCAFTGARISNVVEAQWHEFDLSGDTPTWTIPRANMKVRGREHNHKVILGPTVAAELRTWKALGTGKGYVFPSPAGGKHISRESLEKVYRVTLGLADKHTPHGWRSALTTLAKEEGKFERDVVELAMDHIHDNEVVRAYDRGERLERRVELMAWWDAQLVKAQSGGDVLPMRARAA